MMPFRTFQCFITDVYIYVAKANSDNKFRDNELKLT